MMMRCWVGRHAVRSAGPEDAFGLIMLRAADTPISRSCCLSALHSKICVIGMRTSFRRLKVMP